MQSQEPKVIYLALFVKIRSGYSQVYMYVPLWTLFLYRVYKLIELNTLLEKCDYISDTEKRLRRDLRRTKALLKDAEVVMQKQKSTEGSRVTVRQLKSQVSTIDPLRVQRG